MNPLQTRKDIIHGMGILLILALATLSGCGGGGGSSSTSTRTVTGQVTAPSSTTVASLPSPLRRLASLFILPVQAQTLTGQVVAGATISAYFWPNFAASPVATSQSDANGHYVLNIPSSSSGTTIVIIAEKQTSGGVLREATVIPNLSANGLNGADLNALTTLTAEELAYKARNIASLSPNGVAVVQNQIQNLIQNDMQLSLNVGNANCPLPAKFGDGLLTLSGHPWNTSQVDNIIAQQMNNLQTPTGDVATAKGVVQMMRDFGGNFMGIQSNELASMRNMLSQEETSVLSTAQTLKAFTQRLAFPMRILGLSKSNQTYQSLIGLAPGVYQETMDSNGNTTLTLSGASSAGNVWKILSSSPAGLTMTVQTQNNMSAFAYNLGAGTISFNVTSSTDSTLKYTGSLGVTGWSNSSPPYPTQVSLNISLQDKDLTSPITFTGTLNAAFAGVNASSMPQYSQISYNGNFSSQIGSAQMNGLTIDLNPALPGIFQLKDIKVGSYSLQTQNSPAMTLSMTNAEIDFQYDSVNDKLNPVSAKMSASFTSPSITMKTPGMNIVFPNGTQPGTFSGAATYASSTLNFSGSVNGSWTNSKQGSLAVTGNWVPSVGSPLVVDMSLNLNAEPSATSVLTINKLANGSQNLSGKLTAVMGSTSLSSVALQLTHSPSNFQIMVNWQQGGQVSGEIVNASNTVVANIGPASSLGMPDLGNAIIVKYSDGTFETAQSILPAIPNGNGL